MQQMNIVPINPDAPVTITSPGYFHDYPANSNCSWILQNNDANRVVHVNLLDLAVESMQGCKDSMTIQEPAGEDGPKYM